MTRTYSKEQLDAMIEEGLTGPAGAAGPAAYTTTTANFTQPASAATVSVTVGSTAWMATGQYLYIAGGGYYSVSSITDATHVVVTNLGYTGNAAPSATVASGAKVTAGGVQGATGAAGGVSSWNTRTGAVTPASGDYSYGQISGTPAISSQAQADAGTDDTTIMTPQKSATKLFAADMWADFAFGSVPATSANLTTTTPAQTGYVTGRRVSVASESHTYAASTTTYIDLVNNSTFAYTTSGTVTANAIRLFSVVTSGTAVTAVNDLRTPPTLARGLYPVGLFQGSIAAAQSVPNGTATKMVFNEAYDVSGWFVPGSGATQSRYTPQRRGWYMIGGMVGFATSADQSNMRVYLYKNGAQFIGLTWVPSSGTTVIAGSGWAPIWLNGTTDYCELFGYHDFGAAKNSLLDGSFNWMAGFYIGDTLTATG